MPLDELNPNHPVTAAVHDHWHKIVALLIHKFELGHVVITAEDLVRWERDCPDCVVLLHDRRDGMHLRVITRVEGECLAREEGGLPT